MERRTFKRIALRAGAGAALLFSAGSAISASEVGQADHDDKVTICHRTDDAKKPYVEITVSTNAADGKAGKSDRLADHYGEHQGSLVTSVTEAEADKAAHIQWGDIIPPKAGIENGLNWTLAGKTIFENDCNLVVPTETPTVTSTAEIPTATPTLAVLTPIAPSTATATSEITNPETPSIPVATPTNRLNLTPTTPVKELPNTGAAEPESIAAGILGLSAGLMLSGGVVFAASAVKRRGR